MGHPDFKRLSQKTIVHKFEVWWTNELADQRGKLANSTFKMQWVLLKTVVLAV